MSDQHTVVAREKFLASVKAGLSEPTVAVYILPVDTSGADVDAALVFARSLRSRGVSCVVDTRDVKMKKRFSKAAEEHAYYVCVIGEKERETASVALKDLDENKQETMLAEDAIDVLVRNCVGSKR